MKMLMIGLGSIGNKHLQNIAKYCEKNQIDYHIDAYRSQCNQLPTEVDRLVENIYYEFSNIPNGYDIAFITNPTFLHYSTIRAVNGKANHLFIEKPVFMKPVEDISFLNEDSDSVYYVACPLRHSIVLKRAKEIIDREKIYAVRAICSSYLPEWRKGVDYRKIYSANKERGGGVKLDLIHEWDYLVWLFGFPDCIKSFDGKFSRLEMNAEDIAVYIAKYQDKMLELHLDYFGRETRRQIELFCEKYTIIIDLIQSIITYESSSYKKIVVCEKNDLYYAEMKYFLEMVINGGININPIVYANKVLNIAYGEEDI